MRARSIVCAVVLTAGILPAQACRVAHAPPTKAEAAAVQPPRSGFVGKITWAQTPDKNGRAIVTVRVLESYGAKLPQFIQVLDPGCCVCVGIAHELGEEVVSIVRLGGDQLFQLDY